MTQINLPFLLPKLRPIAELSKTENNYHEQLERILQQMYRRLGGTIDITDDNSEESSANDNQIAQLYGILASLIDSVNDLSCDVVGQLVSPSFNALTKESNYIAADYDFINVKRNAIISLPDSPQVNAVVIVRNGDGTNITIDGNGKTINGFRTSNIVRSGTCLVLHYFIDSDEWLVR